MDEAPETVETTEAGRTEKAEAEDAKQIAAKRRDRRKDFMVDVDLKSSYESRVMIPRPRGMLAWSSISLMSKLKYVLWSFVRGLVTSLTWDHPRGRMNQNESEAQSSNKKDFIQQLYRRGCMPSHVARAPVALTQECLLLIHHLSPASWRRKRSII